MFISYALAGGFALALIGLFCEVATHLEWSRRRRGWGGFAVAIGTMGVVPWIAEQVSQLAVVAACSCIVLVLSIRGYSGTVVERQVDEIEAETAEFEAETELVLEEAAAVAEFTEEILAEDHNEEIHTVEWLNLQIANGYEAKARGEFGLALAAFEQAASGCQDHELAAMFQEEIADCQVRLQASQEDRYRHAS